MSKDGYYVKAAELKNSEDGKFCGFTVAVYNGAGFVQGSAYVGVVMASGNAPLSNTAEQAMERYKNANHPNSDMRRAMAGLPYVDLMRAVR